MICTTIVFAVEKLKQRAEKHHRSVDEGHRAILRETLLGDSAQTPTMTFEAYLRTMPDVGTDADFSRIEGASATSIWKTDVLERGLKKGIDLIAQRDPRQAASLETWLQGLLQQFAGRVLRITADVAEEWGRLNAKRPMAAGDSLLAATANVHNLILATRNVNDIRDVGVRVVNPFDFRT